MYICVCVCVYVYECDVEKDHSLSNWTDFALGLGFLIHKIGLMILLVRL